MEERGTPDSNNKSAGTLRGLANHGSQEKAGVGLGVRVRVRVRVRAGSEEKVGVGIVV